jgi:hypothetical protein
MRIASVCHTEMVGQLIVLQAAMSSTTQSVLGCSPTKAFWVDIVEELFNEFWEKAEWCSCLENFSMRIYDLILALPANRVRLADRLEEAVRGLQAERREEDAELEGLWSSAARV